MRPIRTLPGPRFRILSLATLAAITVSGTALGFGPSTDEIDGDPNPALSAASDERVGDDEMVTEVTTTLAATPDTTTTIPAEPTDMTQDVDAGDGAVVELVDPPVAAGAPVSGAPVTADVVTTIGATCSPDVGSVVDASTDSAPPTTDAPGPTDTPAQTTAVSDTTDADQQGATEQVSAAFTDDFGNGDSSWVPLSGSWGVADGRYVQSDATGYDFISQLSVDLPEQYAISVELRSTEGSLGGGVLVGQPVIGSRRGATLVDFTDGGNFLRWGVYDADSGQYQYSGGVDVGADFDPAAAHTLRVEVRSGRTFVSIDGRSVGEFAAVSVGRAGLATSLSAVSFDDVRIESL